MVVGLCRGPGNIHGWKTLTASMGYCSNFKLNHGFQWEDKDVGFMHVQHHYYREPFHRLSEEAKDKRRKQRPSLKFKVFAKGEMLNR